MDRPFHYRFCDFKVDFRAGELRRNGNKIKLGERPLQVLVALLDHPGEVVTREELQKKLWPNDTIVDFEHSINTAVLKLRDALGDNAENPQFIETLPRRGYRFIGKVDRVASSAEFADALGADREPPSAAPPMAPVGPGPDERSYRRDEHEAPRAALKTASSAEMTGQSVGRFRVREKLGGGGMGVVYRAEDTKLGRTVAIKFLPAELATDRRALERFEREARAASALDHPNICTVHDVGEHGDRPFIVMECLEGQTLRQRLSAGGLQTEEVVDLGIQIAEGLEAAHSKGIIHRDIKPANIYITKRGQGKILDFGLAKLKGPVGSSEAVTVTGDELTSAGLVMGTFDYMSPEQVRGDEIDARSDLFSLGLVLYEMTTGQRALGEETPGKTLDAVLHRTPAEVQRVRPDCPPRLERIIQKAIEKDLVLRYQTASELKTDLQQVARKAGAIGRGLPWNAWKLSVRPRRWLLAGIAVALAGSIALLVALNLSALRDRLVSALGRGRTTPPPKIESLAVLPLQNLSGDPQQEFFADGMTEELITTLGKISALRVISRTSVMPYKGTKKPLRKIADELNADALVEGSVLNTGARVRITANLLQASTDQHLWAESYERDQKDVLAVQDEVAKAIAAKINVTLTPRELAHFDRVPSVNPAAHLAYLRGRHSLEKYTQEDLTRALDYFQGAIEIDPAYAPAYAGLAEAHYGFSNIYISPKIAMPRIKAAALKALALDEGLAEAQVSLATTKMVHDYDYPGAETELKRAIESNPNCARAYLMYGYLLSALGRFEEAKAQLARAQELDPLSLNIKVYRTLPIYFGRIYDQAANELREVAITDPNYYLVHAYLGLVYEEQGDLSKAVSELQLAATLDNSAEPRAQFAHALALAGRTADARSLLAQLMERSKHQYLSPYNIGLIYVALGDHPRALQSLEAAFEDRSEWCVWLKVDPRVDPLRPDPRFQALMRKLRFPP